MRPRSALVLLTGFLAACGTAAAQGPAAQPAALAAAAPEQPVAPALVTGEESPDVDEPLAPAPGDEASWGILDRQDDATFARTIDKVAGMVNDPQLAARVRRRNLALVNVAWEDTGRALGSALGPNISDLTLQVRRRDRGGAFASALMPVIRPPNFVDRTGDVPADRFFVRVGNERAGQPLRSVPLTDVLRDLSAFTSAPGTLAGTGSLLAPRDAHFLVSAQAVFLPIPKTGKAEFNPAIFNYQSAPGSPAVLTLLVTREGTSARVIENRREDRTAAGWGEELYFDDRGQRAAFTAERRSDVVQRIEAQGGPKDEADRSALAKGADVLFLVQVPLVHQQRGVLGGAMPKPSAQWNTPKKAGTGASAPAAEAAPAPMMDRREKSDVETAVLGHGPHVGPYREGHGRRLVRDTRFPIRITVQFYKATSNGVVSEQDLDAISRSIGSVYEHADVVGSLVMPEGDPRRPTAWQRVPQEWFPW